MASPRHHQAYSATCSFSYSYQLRIRFQTPADVRWHYFPYSYFDVPVLRVAFVVTGGLQSTRVWPRASL
eukprot:scaffold249334_cov33-Prasinocladus_malaysianus.AAC.1